VIAAEPKWSERKKKGEGEERRIQERNTGKDPTILGMQGIQLIRATAFGEKKGKGGETRERTSRERHAHD